MSACITFLRRASHAMPVLFRLCSECLVRVRCNLVCAEHRCYSGFPALPVLLRPLPPLSATLVLHAPPSESLLVGNRPPNSGKSTIGSGWSVAVCSTLRGSLLRHSSELGFYGCGSLEDRFGCLKGSNLRPRTTPNRRFACICPHFFNKDAFTRR